MQTENVRLRQELAEAAEARPLNTAAMEDTEVESTLNSLMLVHTAPPPHTHTHVAVALAPHTSAPAHLGLFDVRARMGRVATAGLNSTASFVSTETDRTSVSMPSQFIHPPQ